MKRRRGLNGSFKMKRFCLLACIVSVWFAALWLSSPAAAQEPTITPRARPTNTTVVSSAPVVHAVLFWSDGCPHCHLVIDTVLPPLQEKYGERLVIRMFELSGSGHVELFESALQALDVPKDRWAVPFLIVGDTVLVGSVDIPEQFPELIEKHLAAGGVEPPAIPGLEKYFESPTPAPPRAVVRATMFWMEGCPHCEQVMAQVLPSLQEQYGDQLDIRLMEVATDADVAQLYQVGAGLGLAKEQVAVPFLIVGEHALVGSDQIATKLPGLVEQYLAAGGVDFPDPAIPAAPVAAPEPECVPEASCETAPTPVAAESNATLAPQPPRVNGFELAMGVMVGMVAALGYVGVVFARARRGTPKGLLPRVSESLIPLLLVAGLGVAGYLTYVETQAVPAACGPVGDCNTVQSSPYARLFGILPIGVLGMIGYAAMLALWAWGHWRSGWLSRYASRALFVMALFGVLFSLYLTYLELFVIEAVCAWCLTSAVIMTLLMVSSVASTLQTWNRQA